MPVDYSEYPDNWKMQIRPRILARAGEVRNSEGQIVTEAFCEWCGAENHTVNQRTGSVIVLTVAHLDHDHKNTEVADDRLAALCQACHLKYDMPIHLHRRKYGREQGQLSLL